MPASTESIKIRLAPKWSAFGENFVCHRLIELIGKLNEAKMLLRKA